MANPLHMSHSILAIGALAILAQACTFEIPAEITPSSSDQGDMSDLLGMDPSPLQDIPVIPQEDQGDMPPSPTDMPDPRDEGQPRDMPADMDTPDLSDMPIPPDMPDPPDMADPGRLGDRCADDTSCMEGSCLDVAGDRLCAESCVQGGCTRFGFGCVDGVCVPEEFCADDGTSGPACPTCERCAEVAQCNEIVDGNGQTIYQCLCPDGYYGDGNTCIDRNECSDGSAMCDVNATCTNTPGSFDCLCNPGFMGDGTTCTPMQSTCDMCDVNATCVMDMQGNDLCQCNTGWLGNGITCQDLDECSTPGEGDCPMNEVCVNTPGSFACECAPGFAQAANGCEDINECSTDPCDALATCTNTPGSFQCDCPTGVAGNGITCQPYGSCAEIAQAFPGSPSGAYWIRTSNGTQLEVWCDMVSDGGVGYTLHRVDDPALQTTQQAYASACTSLGMEIVTPRSQEHMDAIISWNAGAPNIVNVFPSTNLAQGISNWQGQCSGQPCSFFINGRSNTRCRTLISTAQGIRWSDGSLAKSCYEYLEEAGTPNQTNTYIVDPDGPMGARPPFATLCAMTLDGGGWTLGATTSDDNQDTWTWDDRDLWTTDESNVGGAPTYNRDYKNAAVHDLPITDIAFYHEPSQDWASYHGVNSSGTPQTVSDLLNSAPAPGCDPNGGFPMTSGTITATNTNLCSTNLYLHSGDYDQDGLNLGPTRCGFYRDFGSPRDESTWGFNWSQSNDAVCPFDDPAYSSWGANQWIKDEEANGVGFGQALGLNTLPAGQGLNYMFLLLRGEKPLTPEGDNTTQQRLVLDADTTGDAGPDCPYGSWDDRGNQVVEQGWVICGIND